MGRVQTNKKVAELSPYTQDFRFLGLHVGRKQSLPVNLCVLVDTQNTQEHYLAQCLTRTLDRQRFKFFYTATRSQSHVQKIEFNARARQETPLAQRTRYGLVL